MLSRMLGPLSVICLGAVAMYVFFAALGGISPSEVLWPTIVVAVLAVLFLTHNGSVGQQPEGAPRVLGSGRRLRHQIAATSGRPA